jgi:hypothetical protein
MANCAYWEVTLVQLVSPTALELSQRLRQLRQQTWPDVRLTQGALAKALGDEEPLAAATVSSWESPTTPKLPPRHRMLAYARFFATRRSVEAEPKLLPMDSLTEEEEVAYQELEAELLGLRNAASQTSPGEDVAIRRSWHFPDAGPATLVCAQLPANETGPLAAPANPNFTELLAYADLDALMELHGHIRAENPAMDVFFKLATGVKPDDLSGHVILVGGIAWNDVTERLSEMARLPVRQVGDPSLNSGEIFIADVDGKEHKFWPKWKDSSHAELIEDVGLLARVSNPLNSSRTLTICNGIHSRGVLGAVRSLTDARLRDANERYISKNFGSSASFAILMSVRIIEGRAMTPDFNSAGGVLRQWPLGVAQ